MDESGYCPEYPYTRSQKYDPIDEKDKMFSLYTFVLWSFRCCIFHLLELSGFIWEKRRQGGWLYEERDRYLLSVQDYS